ncbi:MAG: amylo-alpha-1,6-glucosidase [Oligoflexia bacterium]|nr:amylo-alpha-1,6-glucosidase [Oligoflexia bacterium]
MLKQTEFMNDRREWLETDGLGGFAMGSADGIPRRRYHSWLTVGVGTQGERCTLLNGVEAMLHVGAEIYALTCFQFADSSITPGVAGRLRAFSSDPFPTWTFRISQALEVTCEIFIPKDQSRLFAQWKLLGAAPEAKLFVRPFLSGRSSHALQRENKALNFSTTQTDGRLAWQLFPGVPRLQAQSNGQFRPEPHWYYGFRYEIERERGYDFTEDLASPGVFEFQIGQGAALIAFEAVAPDCNQEPPSASLGKVYASERSNEIQRRAALGTIYDRAADQFIVKRGTRRSIIAGYPWFADWGRDTFIALRGLCLARGRYDEAKQILLSWGSAIRHGLVPNRFPDAGDTPDYNSVDAALWYVIAAAEYLQRHGMSRADISQRTLLEYIAEILAHYRKGTLWNIHCDSDGLLSAGEKGVQLTWMDAKINDWVVTPRIGKPVEIQALWLNALHLGSHLLRDRSLAELATHAFSSFMEKFPAPGGWLYDVVDVNHQPGIVDLQFRINQIFAVGGLPLQIVRGELARRIVDHVERLLYTPIGMRTLSPEEEKYIGHYRGGPVDRDAAYHQGTAWAWLMGPFVEAWVRVRGSTPKAIDEARRRFLAPIFTKLEARASGHVAELSDGSEPFTPGGAPCQAWSLGELLRLDRQVLDKNAAGRQSAAWDDWATALDASGTIRT